MANEHLNYEQMGLTHGHINGLTGHKETKNLLSHLVDNSPTPLIARRTGSGHIQLFFKNDGIVSMPATPSDHRSLKNVETKLFQSLASHGFDYPKMGKLQKSKKKESSEEVPMDPEQPE